MIPRANIIAFHKDGTVRELAELMVTRGHSRIPIYGDSLDDILGIIHIIDLAKCLLKGEGDVKVEDVVNREVKFVSPSMRVLDLLRDMQANKIHMAMVIDEYGGIDGLLPLKICSRKSSATSKTNTILKNNMSSCCRTKG